MADTKIYSLAELEAIDREETDFHPASLIATALHNCLNDRRAGVVTIDAMNETLGADTPERRAMFAKMDAMEDSHCTPRDQNCAICNPIAQRGGR